MIIEKDAWYINGYLAMVIMAVLTLVAVWSFYEQEYWMGGISTAVGLILSTGLTFVQPNQAIIIQFLGRYVGTFRLAGIVMFLPFTSKKRVSLRVKAYQSKTIQVHDANEQPHALSLMLVYKLVDAAKAVFDVENVEAYIDIQSEMAIRYIASIYPNQVQFKDTDGTQNITSEVKMEMLQRLHVAGIELMEVRILPATSWGQPNALKKEKLLPLLQRLIILIEKEELQA